jgi:hypothetical protein
MFSTMKKLIISILLMLNVPQGENRLGGIDLPKEYKHIEADFDSCSGEISNNKGIVIKYDIGSSEIVGNILQNEDNNNNFVWRKQLQAEEYLVRYGLTKDNKLYMVFTTKLSTANFIAQVHNQKEIDEVLSILLQFDPRSSTCI